MISVVIPTYNEEKTLKSTLLALSAEKDIEIIVSDGQSTDSTLEIANAHGIKIVQSQKLRSRQMNLGARSAKGSVILFLHADCSLEKGFSKKIINCIGDGVVGGCFSQAIDSSKLIYRLIETSGNLRAKISKVFYGDQAIFVRRDTFSKMRGFDEVKLFDDVLFSKKLKKEGRTSILKDKVYTSSRRWEAQGLIKTTAINWLVSLGFVLGLSPNFLKKIYQDIR